MSFAMQDQFMEFRDDFIESLTERSDRSEQILIALENEWSDESYAEFKRSIHTVKGEAISGAAAAQIGNCP